MAHYKQLFDPTEFLGAQDFPAPREVTISVVKREVDDKGVSFRAMYFIGKDGEETKRKYKVPNTVMFGLSILLGKDNDTWTGKKITLFADMCLAFGDEEECIRVKFDKTITNKIMKRLKKRKVDPKCYMLNINK